MPRQAVPTKVKKDQKVFRIAPTKLLAEEGYFMQSQVIGYLNRKTLDLCLRAFAGTGNFEDVVVGVTVTNNFAIYTRK